jgi:proteasome lid subunit RPN8/RPN11
MMMFPQQRRRRRELVFSPLAFLKLQYLCHAGPTEVGAFAISSIQRPLYIEELHTLPQQTSSVSVQFDDAAVADYFDRCVDQGYHPSQFARLWLHTHPGSCPLPSGTDEETFAQSLWRYRLGGHGYCEPFGQYLCPTATQPGSWCPLLS